MSMNAGNFPPATGQVWAAPLPPPLSKPSQPPSFPPPPQEGYTPSTSTPPPLQSPPVNAGQSAVQANRVLVERHMEAGKQTAMKAVLPAIAGGGAFLPVAVAFENGPNGAHAYLADDRGGKLQGADGQPQELPVFQVDNRFLIATDKNLSPTSPYILLEQDAKSGEVAYGLSDGLQHNGNLDAGYSLRRSELLEADGTRVMRFNEQYGAKGKPQMDMGATLLDTMTTGGIGTIANLIDQGTGKTGRTTSFQEVRIDPQGQAVANDVSYKFLPTAERAAPPQATLTAQLASSWSQLKGQGSREEKLRTIVTTQDGSLQLAPDEKKASSFNLGSLKGMFKTETPRQTIVVTPLNTEYGPQRPGTDRLQSLMTGGQAVTAAPTRDEPQVDEQAQRFSQFEALSNQLLSGDEHKVGRDSAKQKAVEAATQQQDPNRVWVSELTHYGEGQLAALDGAMKQAPNFAFALQPQRDQWAAYVDAGRQFLQGQ